MKESRIYLEYLRRNWLILTAPILLCLLISLYLYSKLPAQIKATQAFKLIYNLENIQLALPLTDEAVSELRSQNFDKAYKDTSVNIYKNAPLLINIEVVSAKKQTGFEVLEKEADFLKQNFSVSKLTDPEITLEEPNLAKYLLTGILIGFLIGFSISLVKEYFKIF